jgi:hypothetical protein
MHTFELFFSQPIQFSSETTNLMNNWDASFGGQWAHRKGSTYTGKRKHRKMGYTLSGIQTHDLSVPVTVHARDYVATEYLNFSVKDENCVKTAVRKRPRSAIAAKLDYS